MTGAVLATHLPVFLDRRNLRNNIIVDRVGSDISLRRVSSVQELASLQFRLLGNRLETMFLPGAIVIVEGRTDHAYLTRVIALRNPRSTVSVIQALGEGRIREILAVARQMLGDIARSPYADRVFVVLDSRHGAGLKDAVVGMGLKPENVVVWAGNGVEYVYPHTILERRFGSSSELSIIGDRVMINGHSLTKQELCTYVVDSLRGDEELPAELVDKLIKPLEKLLS